LIDAKEAKAAETVKTAIKLLDKAAAKKVIKKNSASRKKSRLMKKLNAII
jgi:small subunit ribosomal protein S20